MPYKANELDISALSIGQECQAERSLARWDATRFAALRRRSFLLCPLAPSGCIEGRPQ